MSDTSWNCWKFSVMSVSSLSAWEVESPSIVSKELFQNNFSKIPWSLYNAAMTTWTTFATVRQKYEALAPLLHEKTQRRWAACEARALGRGGISRAVSFWSSASSTLNLRVQPIQF